MAPHPTGWPATLVVVPSAALAISLRTAGYGGDASTDTLILEPAGWDRDVKVRVAPEHTTELHRLLGDAGLPVSVGAEFSHGPVLDLLIATVETPEMWVALGGSVTAFLTRNSFRRVRIGKGEIILVGSELALAVSDGTA